jgi:hypothetical protein
MIKNLEMFNEHQQDVRSRTDSLVKAVFVLSGGALTVSIGVFLKSNRLPLNELSLMALKCSWWFLFTTIVCGVAMLSTIIIRDYRFGERWRNSLRGDLNKNTSGKPGKLEFLIIILGVVGVSSFVLGMLGLAYVATETVIG